MTGLAPYQAALGRPGVGLPSFSICVSWFHMTPEQTKHFKKKLLEEKVRIERDLKTVGRINPDNPKDWEPTAANLNIDPAEEEERASEITDFEERSAIEFELEKHLNEIVTALERLENGTFGICRVCKGLIEEERLEANYSADTCKTHKE